MGYKVKTIEAFEKKANKLIKKYPSLKKELFDLVQRLQENPVQGTSLGNNCYKIRLSIASKSKGKSGGARIITNIIVSETTVYLLSIYDKSEQENITSAELKSLLGQIPL